MADRHRFRAGWHDYNCGIYFVTICCANARHYFGEIEDGNMALSPVGIIAESQIQSLSSHFANVEICNYVVMPNHVHVVIAVNPIDTRTNVPENPPVGTLFKASAQTILHPSNNIGCLKPSNHDASLSQEFHHNSLLSIIIRCLKGGITRDARRLKMHFEWQSRYHEHIISNQKTYEKIMSYIDLNVENWCRDRFYRVP